MGVKRKTLYLGPASNFTPSCSGQKRLIDALRWASVPGNCHPYAPEAEGSTDPSHPHAASRGAPHVEKNAVGAWEAGPPTAYLDAFCPISGSSSGRELYFE
jgi:endogenous inhibitor of DNA gyrase (YacG/DUF329 family)